MNIGPRIWKTGLAVALTLWISQYFELQHSFLAVIAAIVSLQPTISDSFKKGWQRILATIIGVAVSVMLLFLFGSSPVTIAVGVVIAILICVKYELNDSLMLASITVVIIMAGYQEQDMFIYAAHRTALPFLGIFVAICINYIFSPPKLVVNVQEKLRQLNERMETLFMKVIRGFFACNLYHADQAEEMIQKVHKVYEEAEQCVAMYKGEFGNRRLFAGNGSREVKQVKKFERSLGTLWLIAERVFDIHKLVVDRQERFGDCDDPGCEYGELRSLIEELLYLTCNLQKNLLEYALQPDKSVEDVIEQQEGEIKGLRKSLQNKINAWQENHHGVKNINALIEIATLVYDLNKICDYLFRFKENIEE